MIFEVPHHSIYLTICRHCCVDTWNEGTW